MRLFNSRPYTRQGCLFALLRVPSCPSWIMLFLCVGGAAFAQGGKAKKAEAPTYARDLLPILKSRCIVCHNQSTINNPVVSGGLALDSLAAMNTGAKTQSGARAIFLAGKSGESELIKR